VEGHPFAQVLDDQDGGSVVSRDYFDDTPQLEACPYTYTDGCAELAHPEQVEFPRTTMRYDRARKNLDRHPNYILAAYMASGT
jgi:hypothetical protein